MMHRTQRLATAVDPDSHPNIVAPVPLNSDNRAEQYCRKAGGEGNKKPPALSEAH
jgi:hypothetical protein